MQSLKRFERAASTRGIDQFSTVSADEFFIKSISYRIILAIPPHARATIIQNDTRVLSSDYHIKHITAEYEMSFEAPTGPHLKATPVAARNNCRSHVVGRFDW